MVYLSRQGTGVLTKRRDIAVNADIPPHFLAKIAQDLAKAHFIEIRQGTQGGFILLRDPKTISLLEVVETMIGEIYLNDCVTRPKSCKIYATCTMYLVWTQARDQLRETLNQVTFDQLSANNPSIPFLSIDK